MWKGDRMKTISGIEFASEHNGTDVFRLIELAYEQGRKDGHNEQLGTNLAEVGTDLISRQAAIEILSQYPFENVINCISILEEMPSAQFEIYHCIDCALYNEPQCLMAFENACWAEPYGYCHMFTRKENDEDE